MTKINPRTASIVLSFLLLVGCEKTDDDAQETPDSSFFSQYDSRVFDMGFSSWTYGPTIDALDDTYAFIDDNTDLYSEHIDANIPWEAWMNDDPLPAFFTDQIQDRVSRRLPNKKLLVGVSILNLDRADLAYDLDGELPPYTHMNDQAIEDAYFKHLAYIIDQLNPDYLLTGIEVNELLINSPEKWDDFKMLMSQINTRIAAAYPDLVISESITLHNLFNTNVPGNPTYLEEITNYVNAMELATMSFYPFFKSLNNKGEFQNAFDFLHANITSPIAFSETGHISEDVYVEAINFQVDGTQSEQQEYLELLCINAQEHDYEFILWWAHRDYNELLETFPEDLQDLGSLWVSTGLVNEDGISKKGHQSWKTVLDK